MSIKEKTENFKQSLKRFFDRLFLLISICLVGFLSFQILGVWDFEGWARWGGGALLGVILGFGFHRLMKHLLWFTP